MKAFLFIILQFVYLGTLCQSLIDNNSHFLEMDVNSKHVVYFKSHSNEPDEYKEGSVYLYDVENKKSSLLNRNTYILSFLNIKWARNGKYFFLSDGVRLTVFSFKDNKTKVLFEASKGDFINNLEISNSARYIVFNVKKSEEGKKRQVVYRIDWATDVCEEIYSIDDTSRGEMLKNESFITDSGEVFIHDIKKRLFEIRVDKSTIDIEQFAKDVHYLDEKYLYYSMDDALIQLTYKTFNKLKIFQSNRLEVQYVGKYNEEIVINFNDNIYVYNSSGKIVSLNLESGNYEYIDQDMAIKKSMDKLCFYTGFRESKK